MRPPAGVLPPAKTRGCWPTLPDNNEEGLLSKLDPWPLLFPMGERPMCFPRCAGCLRIARAAATCTFTLWSDEGADGPVDKAYFWFCETCTLAARAGGELPKFLLRHLRGMGTWLAAKKRVLRWLRSPAIYETAAPSPSTATT